MMTTPSAFGSYLLLCYKDKSICPQTIVRHISVTILKFCLLISFLTPGRLMAQGIPAPTFLNEPELNSNSGYLSLNWEYADSMDISFVVEVSRDSLFKDTRVLYEGPDRASFISGLENGRYYYRVRASDGDQYSPWSDMTRVVIRHHSLSFALLLFGIGMVVFAATVAIIIYGNRQVESLNPEHLS